MAYGKRNQDYPDFIPIGGSIRLISCRAFAREFGVPEGEVVKLMNKLKVPLFQVNPELCAGAYINLFSLECVLHGLLRPGGKGFRGKAEPGLLAEGLESYGSPLLKEVELVTKMYGTLDRQTLKDRAKKLAAWFRIAGDKVCRKRIKELRALCIQNGISVGRISLRSDPKPGDLGQGDQG